MSRADTPAEIDSIRARLAKLTPMSQRQWGTMTPNEMLCHLADALRGPLGDRPMTENDWLRWWYMHTDHHLRQFGC